MGNASYITREGLEKIKKELDQLLNVERPAISRMIADARDKGDLAENSEYHAAKEAQGMLEMKISQLENIVANSRIIDNANLDSSRVRLLNKIKIRNKETNAIMDYIIVPESEADLKNGKIAINTPVAQGLLGKKTGDVVKIRVPSGEVALEILNISV
ncbi:MAG: transcription elongation factor GreA [Bacteroides sp. SM23_62_1]|nr:MAG: transcription elongation factor GreA [Bacteroides sp. SM23_62_1]